MINTVVFDLDDTLVYEIDYLKSAFKHIAQIVSENEYLTVYETMLELYYQKKDVFGFIEMDFEGFSKHNLLKIYRNHFPEIQPIDGAKDVLKELSKDYHIGLVTDGYSITQRNKLKSLSFEPFFKDIIISEEFGSNKTCERNFKYFHKNESEYYFYIGDNTSKDFFMPNQLDWITICLKDRGLNIHKQNFDVSSEFSPKYVVDDIRDVINIVHSYTQRATSLG